MCPDLYVLVQHVERRGDPIRLVARTAFPLEYECMDMDAPVNVIRAVGAPLIRGPLEPLMVAWFSTFAIAWRSGLKYPVQDTVEPVAVFAWNRAPDEA